MKTIQLVTHSGMFHADDIFSTALLNVYFKNKEPKTKLKYKRSILQKDFDMADIVYDIGRVYNPKKLRFDHHQNDANLIRENGIPYAAFGLVFKHFGPELISLISKEKNKIFLSEVFEAIESKLVMHIDALDNGKVTYKQLFKGVDVATIDNYFQMCKLSIDIRDPKGLDKMFFTLVKFSEPIIENVINYAIRKQTEKKEAIKIYNKTKDKRVIVCERFYDFNFNKFPEPLLTVFPDTRGGWSAKNVQTGEELYDARFYFPESWRGLAGKELEEVTKIPGSIFCHKTGFLAIHETKEGVLKMIDLAFQTML